VHAGHTRMRWLAGIVGLLLGCVVLAASLQGGPPSTAGQRAVASRLEPVALLIADLGVGMWLDDRDCRMLMLDLDESSADPQSCAMDGRAFTPAARATFDRVAAAVAGAVPEGRVRIVSVAEDFTDAADGGPVRRSVTFEVAPQLLGAFDSPLDTWEWTWSENPRPGETGNLSDHWRFTERPRNEA
jgi:hypothetical protein